MGNIKRHAFLILFSLLLGWLGKGLVFAWVPRRWGANVPETCHYPPIFICFLLQVLRPSLDSRKPKNITFGNHK